MAYKLDTFQKFEQLPKNVLLQHLLHKTNTMLIGNKLKSKRTEKNLSAEYIADKVGIDISTYRKYERDDVSPSLEKLEKIANALDTPIFSLFYSSTGNANENLTGNTLNLQTYTLQLSKKTIEKCEEQIKELKSDKEYLKEEITTLKEEIKNLKNSQN